MNHVPKLNQSVLMYERLFPKTSFTDIDTLMARIQMKFQSNQIIEQCANLKYDRNIEHNVGNSNGFGSWH